MTLKRDFGMMEFKVGAVEINSKVCIDALVRDDHNIEDNVHTEPCV